MSDDGSDKPWLTVYARKAGAAESAETVPIAMMYEWRTSSPDQPKFIGTNAKAGLLMQFVPATRSLWVLDGSWGFWERLEDWVLVAVTAGVCLWRVVPSFKSWSRKAMRRRPNLLSCLPCKLSWFSPNSKEYFVTVYLVLTTRWTLPRDLVDALILTCLGSNDIRGN